MPTEPTTPAADAATRSMEPMVFDVFTNGICAGELTMINVATGQSMKLATGLDRAEVWPMYSRRVRVTLTPVDEHGESLEETP